MAARVHEGYGKSEALDGGSGQARSFIRRAPHIGKIGRIGTFWVDEDVDLDDRGGPSNDILDFCALRFDYERTSN